MTLSCSVKVSKNNRYGVYKRGMGAEEGEDAGVVIAGTGNECSNNGKTGICSTGGVGIDVIQVENNGGYGIYASGKMLINEIGHWRQQKSNKCDRMRIGSLYNHARERDVRYGDSR